MFPTNRAKPTDLFNFQGIRKRVLIAPEYSRTDERLYSRPHEEDASSKLDNEYNELDSIEQQFESYVRPTISQSDWIANRQHERNEINRLGDLLDFYDHKPQLNELEKRVYKRMTRKDRAIQTDADPESTMKIDPDRTRIPVIRLPTPLAMERVEEFLANNHWRLVDLFRTLDRDKSWALVKEDFMRLIEKEHLNVTEAQAEELITCFCRETHVPMNYKKFARGRSLYKKTVRENMMKTPTSIDTQLESDTSTSLSSYHLQIPPADTTHSYPARGSSSSYSRSTISSFAKYRGASASTMGTESKLSTYP